MNNNMLNLPTPTAIEAREEDNEHAEEEQDRGREDGPHAGGVVGARAGVEGVGVVVDVVSDHLLRVS